MLTKKEQILKSGLELFATEGYNATSTNKIAKKAGVSEGLIFRHFTNKEGLLQAIFELGSQRYSNLYADLFSEQDPILVLRKLIEIPLQLDEEEYEFWRFQFRLKWELQYHNPEKTKPLLKKLVWAFEKLKYQSPVQEAHYINNYLEGLSSNVLLGQPIDRETTMKFLFEKYKIQ